MWDKRGVIKLVAFCMVLLMFVSPFVFAEEVSLKNEEINLESGFGGETVELVEEDISVNEKIEDEDLSDGGEIVMMGEGGGAMPLLVYLQKAVMPEDKLVLFGYFAVSLSTGSAIYSYPIQVPAGVTGLQPNVNLFYSNQQTKGEPGLLGAGWSLSQNYIERYVNYTFNDSSDDSFVLVLNGERNKLVYNDSENKYHTKIKSFLDIEKVSGADNDYNESWIVKTKDGTTYRFGYNSDSELVSNLHSYVVRWSLDIVNDNDNNSIFYSYKENPYDNDNGTVYPDKIEYNNDKERKIEFVYESSDRSYKWEVYKNGNKIKYSRRLKEIIVTANSSPVNKYVFGYSSQEDVVLDFLSNITQYGSDNSSSLSPEQIYQIYLDTKDGYSNASTIVSQETSMGENWTCQVTPNDAAIDGITKQASRIISANESQGRLAILEGINNTISNAAIYTDLEIDVRYLSGTQMNGVFDKVAFLGNQSWAFNYVTGNENFTNMNNSYNVFNVWENSSLSYSEIVSQVESYINESLL